MEQTEEMTETVQTRLTAEQKTAMRQAAKGLGLTSAAFMRMAVLSKVKEVGS